MNILNDRKYKFHGLSTPDDLIKMWNVLKHDEDSNSMNVIFDYKHPDQLKEGFNIVNILYDENEPNETGHYVLITNLPNYKEYFDPIPENITREIKKMNELNNYFDDELNISLDGKQKMGTSDCGYHCLTHALNIYSEDLNDSPVSGKLPANPTKNDILMDMLKLQRAIYYQLKTLTDNKVINLKLQNERMKDKYKDKNKGKGLADDYPESKLKVMSYNQLKNLIEQK